MTSQQSAERLLVEDDELPTSLCLDNTLTWSFGPTSIVDHILDIYPPPGKTLGTYNRLFPAAWKQVDEYVYRFDPTTFDAFSEGSVYA